MSKRTTSKQPQYCLDPDFSLICTAAVRYSLGRMTYMPSVVQHFIIRHIDHLSPKDLYVLIRDIDQHGKDVEGNVEPKMYGMDFDYRDWMAFKDKLQVQYDKLTTQQ